MILTLSAALETLRRQQPDAMWQIANQNPANAAQNYMLLGLMPEMQKPGYQAQINNLVIRSTMAGLAGMDSPYPPGGAMQLRTFLENTAKIANEVLLSEQAQREMQDMVRMMMFNNQPTQDYLLGSVLNFADKIIAQAHFDTFEWLRGQALATGTIDWTYNNKNLVVDYGIPAANKLTSRSGNDAYNGSTSKFWNDVQSARRKLRRYGGVRFICNPDTADAIRYNSANNAVAVEAIEASASGIGAVTLRRLAADDAQFSADVDDVVRLETYARQGEVIDTSNPGATVNVNFIPDGKVIAVSTGANNYYQPGDGSTPLPIEALGYTHIAPTIEGGGMMGRWIDVYTPPHAAYEVRGRGVTNGLPVITEPERIVIMTTTIT
jgi:hypothetical protein